MRTPRTYVGLYLWIFAVLEIKTEKNFEHKNIYTHTHTHTLTHTLSLSISRQSSDSITGHRASGKLY